MLQYVSEFPSFVCTNSNLLYVYIYHILFVYSYTFGHLDCFYFLVVVNSRCVL